MKDEIKLCEIEYSLIEKQILKIEVITIIYLAIYVSINKSINFLF